MPKLVDIMGGYLDLEPTRANPDLGPGLLKEVHGNYPIKPAQAFNWEKVSSPNRLMKKFTFDDFNKMSSFITELMDHQEEVQHHAKITIDYRDVIVEVYTHDINDVTELDHDFAQFSDRLFQDVSYYSMEVETGDNYEY
jgi:4a-hydroxytetrahydrobiopterin dehydratase